MVAFSFFTQIYFDIDTTPTLTLLDNHKARRGQHYLGIPFRSRRRSTRSCSSSPAHVLRGDDRDRADGVPMAYFMLPGDEA